MPGWLSCCCGGGDSDDERSGLVNDEYSSNRYEGHSSNGRIDSGYGPGPSPTPGTDRKSHPRTREDDEQAILQKILDQTQSNIIDVSAIQQTYQGAEFMNRSAKYDELLKKSSTLIPSTRGSAGGRHSSRYSSPMETNCILSGTTAGNRTVQLLGSQPIPSSDLAEINQLASSVQNAVESGIKVTHKEELVTALMA